MLLGVATPESPLNVRASVSQMQQGRKETLGTPRRGEQQRFSAE
jgi:hypothetical protein